MHITFTARFLLVALLAGLVRAGNYRCRSPQSGTQKCETRDSGNCPCDEGRRKSLHRRWRPTDGIRTGPPPNGTLWPQPQKLAYYKEILNISPGVFKFQTTYKCDILFHALARYEGLIFAGPPSSAEEEIEDGMELSHLTITIATPCPNHPHLGMNETYSLEVRKEGKAELKAESVWGALRGLETFSQLVYTPLPGQHRIRTASILDFPRFPWRGVLLDTSRHFVAVDVLEETIVDARGLMMGTASRKGSSLPASLPIKAKAEFLVRDIRTGVYYSQITPRQDLLAQNKFNVFHWHIVDDPSFPYTSAVFPDLSRKGAFSPRHTYGREELGRVVEYARLRGIRVLPEFDTPGHTLSWGLGQSKFLTECYANGEPTGTRYLPDVAAEGTWDFLYALFTEIRQLFPDKFVHLGGDEVSYYYKCWQSNPRIQTLMKLWNITSMRGVENYYFQKFIPLLEQLDPNMNWLLWDDVFPEIQLPKNKTILHEWRNFAGLAGITKAGYRGILSSCWYLDHIELASAAHPEWYKFYQCDPQNFSGTAEQKDLVIGGEACLWGEFVDATNLTPRLWPRASAIAERLWSSAKLSDPVKARARLHEHRCRMILRGHAAEPPSGPSFCPFEYDPRPPTLHT